MNKIIMLLFSLILMSCNKEKKQIEKEEDKTVVVDSVKRIKIKLKASELITDDWAEIIAFESNLGKIEVRDIKSEKDIESLKNTLEELKKTIPKRFKNEAIAARIKVLETEVLILNQHLIDGDLKLIREKINQIKQAYNIFVSQIEAFIIKEKDYEKYN